METTTPAHDVIVVGARCAGAATAMLLARQGHDVLVVDRAELPSDTLSTHALATGGVVQLSRWGLLDEVVASGAPPIRTIGFHVGGADPIVRPVRPRAGVEHLLAPRRYILDAILLDAARRAGATVRTGVTVTDVVQDATGRATGIRMRDRDGRVDTVGARFVIGADGMRSRVARAVGAPVIDERAPSGAAHYLYVTGLDADGFEFHVADGGFAGVFPTHDGAANVWMCVPEARMLHLDRRIPTGFLELLSVIAPSLGARVAAATMSEPVRSGVRLRNHVLQATGPGWALVGDAAYHRDPISGHGITDAFRDAELAAYELGRHLDGEVAEATALTAYDHTRLQALRPIFDVTTALGAFPAVDEFVCWQRRYAELVDAEADWLAARPTIPDRDRLVAA